MQSPLAGTGFRVKRVDVEICRHLTTIWGGVAFIGREKMP